MFRTCAALVASLNAPDAVAGAGASVILGSFDTDFCGKDCFDRHFGEDGRIADGGSDGEAVAGKNACERNMPTGPGLELGRDAVDVFRADVAAGVVVTAAFDGKGTI